MLRELRVRSPQPRSSRHCWPGEPRSASAEPRPARSEANLAPRRTPPQRDRDRIREFDGAYFAASVDHADKNRKFAESLELDYPILSDPDKQVAKAYGVLRAAGLFAARQTIYIGADGKILYLDDDVKVATAGNDLAARLEALGVKRR